MMAERVDHPPLTEFTGLISDGEHFLRAVLGGARSQAVGVFDVYVDPNGRPAGGLGTEAAQLGALRGDAESAAFDRQDCHLGNVVRANSIQPEGFDVERDGDVRVFKARNGQILGRGACLLRTEIGASRWCWVTPYQAGWF
jgi:hypothetical protein